MLRKLIILLGAAAISASASTHRLATYNLRYTGADTDTEGKDWGQRGPVCRDVILNYDLDIVGFQEVTGEGRTYRNPVTGRTQLNDLKAWLPDYEIIAWDRDGTARREYVATAYKKSRYQLLDQGWFFISATPDRYSMGWDTVIETHSRILGWLKLKDKESGQEFIYATTHTNNGWSLDGPYGSQLVAEKIKEIAGDLPVMVVADYNSSRTAVHAQKGLKAYHASFHDAAIDVPDDQNYSLPVTNRPCTWTYNAFHPVSETTYSGSEIDYQFYRGMKILERHIVTEEFSYNGKNYPSSDHFPLYVVAELTPTQPKSIFVDCNAGDGGDGSITAPFRTISQAIDASDIDDVIYLTSGTYRESVQPKYTVSILGGYNGGFSQADGTSVIDGEGLEYSPVYAPVSISLTLKNLTVRGYKSSDVNRDGAIRFQGSSIDMENVIVENNSATTYGGGLSVFDTNNPKYCACNNIRLLNCTFRNNSADYGGGMAVGVYDVLDIDGCTFEGNSANMSGGGAYLTFGTPESNRIWFTQAKATIFNSSFVNNSATRFGALHINDEMPNVQITTVNTTFAGNTLEAKGGLPNVIKTYGGTAIYAVLTSRPADCKLSKVGNSKLNLGHVTVIGNHASCTSPANYLASALTFDGAGDVKLVNSIVAGNSSNGANAYPDITVNIAGGLKKETLNLFTSASTINFTPDSKTKTAADAATGTANIAEMFAGSVEDGKFIPYVHHTDAEPTPFVPQKSTLFGGTETATLTVLQRNIEKEFSVDIDRDGSVGTQLKTDQLRRQRNSKSVPGAVEFTEEYSAEEEIESDIHGSDVNVSILSDGRIRLVASKNLGRIDAVDFAGRLIASANIDTNDYTMDLSYVRNGLYIITCLGNSFKIMK